MFLALINESGHIATADVIEAASNQWKTLCREINDGRSKIQFAVEPRFHGVLVGRLDIHQVSWLQRANVTGNDFLGNQVLLLTADIRDHFGAKKHCYKDGGGNRKPFNYWAARR